MFSLLILAIIGMAMANNYAASQSPARQTQFRCGCCQRSIVVAGMDVMEKVAAGCMTDFSAGLVFGILISQQREQMLETKKPVGPLRLLAGRDREADGPHEANPHSLSFQLDSRKRQRGLVSANSGSFDYDEEPKSQTGSVTAGRQRAASPDEEDEDEEEDSDEEDSDDSEPSRAPEGAYDPADYANLPVNTKIKELFQYITR